VEHPVTEMITGLDLVELQIRVAQGEKLPKQKNIKMDGHAIEARLYAEDPANDFLPSIGRLQILEIPKGARIDTGVEQGSEVSIYYDPMIAKLIVFRDSRDSALSELDEICRNTKIYPVRTNTKFLHDCISHAEFVVGNVSTNFIAEHLRGSDGVEPYAILDAVLMPPRIDNIFGANDGWRLNQPSRKIHYRYLDGDEIELLLQPRMDLKIDNRVITEHQTPEGRVVFVDGLYYLTTDASGDGNALDGGNALTAPMPGKIIAVNAKIGDTVKAGDPLIIMEAMKMEMTLEAPRDGIVAEMTATPDALVTDGEMLLSLEEDK